MVPNQPGLDETEEQGAGSLDSGNQLSDDTALNSADEQTPPTADTPVTDENSPAESDSASDAAPEPTPAESADPPVSAESSPAEADTVSEPAPESSPAESTEKPAEPSFAEQLAEADASNRPLVRGMLVEGTITATSPTEVRVDVGGKSEGIITSAELEKMNKQTLVTLKTGETITVYVVNPQDRNGNIVLSINRAMEEMDWQKAEEFLGTQDVYDTQIAGYNRGGLIVRFGRLRGFVPQSQLAPERRQRESDPNVTPEERYGGLVGEAITVKVMEVDRSKNRLILSERTATRESREKRKETLIAQLTVGEVRTGKVVSLEDFGAFVDVGGAEGLVHLTEMSWHHVTHPRDLLKVGQEVTVEVISIDPVAKRIGLSMKRQAPDPWDTVATGFQVGQLVKGTVTKLTKFGAFAQLTDLPEIEGLIHISELSDKRVAHPREVVTEGDVLTLRVVKIDVAERRLGLSLKRVNSTEYLDFDWQGE